MSETKNEGNGKEKLKSILNSIVDVVTDISTLEVTTVSGNIKLIFDETEQTDDKGNKTKSYSFKKSDALANLIGAQSHMENGSEIYIVAYSRVDFDQDTVNFVKSGLTDDDRKLYQLHLDSIKAAQEARSGFLKMLAGLFD